MLFAPVHHPFPNGRLPRSLAVATVLVLVLGGPRAAATTSAIGGADQTSENFSATGGWQAVNMTPGCLPTGVTLTGTHLLISEVAPRGAGTGASSDSSEYIEIYNPTALSVSLDNYYLSDHLTYYRIVNGPYAIAPVVDYNLRFPPGSTIEPGEVILVVKSELGFLASFGGLGGLAGFCTTKIFAMDALVHPPTVFTPMIDAAGSSLGTSSVGGGDIAGPTGAMTNPSATNGEWVVLYQWDGVSDLVCDVDYASWGDGTVLNNPKMDKAGVLVDGPDLDIDLSLYNNDTAALSQTNLGAFALLTKPNTYQRMGGEVGETASGGNGCTEAPAVGSVAGSVVADCPAAGTSLLGVQVDAFEVGSGDLVGMAVTDAAGGYLIENLPAGTYTVTVVAPLGYTTPSPELPVTVDGGETASADFALHCVAITANPRTIGFWKHQVGVATGGNGQAQVDATALCAHLDLIAGHFNGNAINQVVVYEPPVSGLCEDKLQVTKQLLNLVGSVAMIDRAKQQLMALLFNVAAGYISQTQVVSANGATVSQAITYCDNLIDSPTGDYERAKTIADLINNGQPVPSGMVPAGTQVISYSRKPTRDGAPTLSIDRMHPNPARGAFNVVFSLVGDGPARLELLDVAGRRVLRHDLGHLRAGRHSVALGAGAPLPPGVYSVRLSDSRLVVSRAVIVAR